MSISKTKINIFKKLVPFFVLLFIFLVFPISTHAYKITPSAGPTGPADGAIRDNSFNFTFNFKITKDAGEDETEPVAIIFAVTKDGEFSKFSEAGVPKEIDNLYIFNQTLGNALKMTQPIALKWAITVPATGTAKKIGWAVRNFYVGTIYANKSFTLGDSNSGGYYHIDKYKRANAEIYFFIVSAKTNTPADCEKDRTAITKDHPDVIEVGTCTKYEKSPSAPAEINLTPAKTDTTYTPLAPLPGIGTPGCIGTDGKTCIDTQKNDTTNKCPFGDYLNVMIKLFFGICGVLAVIMITMGGIQYMTSDLVSSKEAGKESITHAIFGLLLALSAYLILNTINPDLLNACLNNVKTQSITIQEEEELMPVDESLSNNCTIGSTTIGCSSGLVSVKTTSSANFVLCNSIATKVKTMVDKAKAENIILTGGSCRSSTDQKALRIQNCGGDFTNKDVKCHPATALPGTSRHENGLAIDFKCSGVQIKSTTNNCFLWLKSNAATGGLSNLKTGTEPWHWSTDGK